MKKAFVLRLNSKAFEQLKNRATQNGSSINSYCVSLLNQQLHTPKDSAIHPLIEQIKKTYASKLIGIAIFGSVARGTQTENSDLDILLVLDKSIPLQSSLYKEWDNLTTPLFSSKISPHFLHIPNNPKEAGSLWLEVALEGKVLYDTDRKLADFLRHLRILIAEGVFIRSYSYGVPYWKKVI